MDHEHPPGGPDYDEVQAVLFRFAESCFAGQRPQAEPDEAARLWLMDYLQEVDVLRAAEVRSWAVERQLAMFTLLQFSVLILEDMQRRGATYTFANLELLHSDAQQLSQPLLTTLSTFQSIIAA